MRLGAQGFLTIGDVKRIQHVLRMGGAAILPSDTGYGIATLPFLDAGRKTLKALSTEDQQMTPLAFGSAEQAAGFLPFGGGTERVVAALCPGALTLVCPAPRDRVTTVMCDALGTPGTIGFRIPASPVQLQLATELKQPITTTALRDDDLRIVRDDDLAVELMRERSAPLERPDLVTAVLHAKFAYTEHSTVVEIVDRAYEQPGVNVTREGAVPAQTVERAARTLGVTDFQDHT